MIKEIKYLFYLIVFSIFIFLVINYYFSDYYEKKSNRKISNFLDNFNSKNIDLPIIKSDTKPTNDNLINSSFSVKIFL